MRVGGSQAVTVPQRCSTPSFVRSKKRPPTRGSISTCSTFSSPIECVAIGHQPDISAVNTWKARSGVAFTVIDFRSTSSSVACIVFSFVLRFRRRLERGERFVPEPVHVVA